MHDNRLLMAIRKAAEDRFGTRHTIREWARAVGLSHPTVRCFLRNEPMKPPTINKLIEPLGYEAQIVIRKKKVA